LHRYSDIVRKITVQLIPKRRNLRAVGWISPYHLSLTSNNSESPLKTLKAADKKATSSKVQKTAKGGKAARKKRQTGVRGRVLEILAAGPRSSAELVTEGGFSTASLYLNLKSLKDDGLVESERDGRVVMIRLSGKAASGKPAPAAKPVAVKPIEGVVVSAPVEEVIDEPAAEAPKRNAVVLAYVPRDLHEALDGVTRRLSPIEGTQEKLMVLDRLARSLPTPVASVLRSIMDDVARLSEDVAA
jgi:DNA-binding transcriptional ArsR family regulator